MLMGVTSVSRRVRPGFGDLGLGPGSAGVILAAARALARLDDGAWCLVRMLECLAVLLRPGFRFWFRALV
jgi:hypothetical protein